MQWHYKKDGVWIGPFSDEEKDRLVESGVLTRDTPVCVCYDSATFVPSSPSIKRDCWIESSNTDEKKTEDTKYYYYGIHSDMSEEREIELAEKELNDDAETGDIEEWEYQEEEDEDSEFTEDEDEWEDDDDFFEETDDECSDDDSELVDDEDEQKDNETNDRYPNTTDEQEKWNVNGEDVKELEESDEGEDVLAVTSHDHYLFDISNYVDAVNLEDNFDELAVESDFNLKDDNCKINDDPYADDSIEQDVLCNSIEQSDVVFHIDQRLSLLEEALEQNCKNLEQNCKNVDQFITDVYGRLDSIEDETEIWNKGYEKLDADVKALSIEVSTTNGDWKNSFNDQAERLAMTQEKINGIQRRISVEFEDKNRRLVKLEETTTECENTSRIVSLLTGDVSSFKKEVHNVFDEQRKQNLLSGSRIDELEESVCDLKRVVGQDYIKQQFEPSTRVLRGTVTDLRTRVDQFITTLRDAQEKNRNLDEKHTTLVSEVEEVEKKLDAIQNRCAVQEQNVKEVKETHDALIQNDKRDQKKIKSLETQIKNTSSNLELEQGRRTEELQKRDQRITHIVENFTQFQEEYDKLRDYVNSLEKKFERLERQMIVVRSRSEEKNDDDVQTSTENFFERWGGKFIVDSRFRKFVIVASVGILFLIYEILRFLI